MGNIHAHYNDTTLAVVVLKFCQEFVQNKSQRLQVSKISIPLNKQINQCINLLV